MADDEAKKQRAIAAMMSDLGLERIEELAQDDSRDGRRLHFPMQSVHASPLPSEPQPQVPRVVTNEAAKGWNSKYITRTLQGVSA